MLNGVFVTSKQGEFPGGGPDTLHRKMRRGMETFRSSRVRVLGRDVLLQEWVVTRQFDKWVIIMHACKFLLPLISIIAAIPGHVVCAVAPGVGSTCSPASGKNSICT